MNPLYFDLAPWIAWLEGTDESLLGVVQYEKLYRILQAQREQESKGAENETNGRRGKFQMDKVGLKTIEQIGDLAISVYPKDEFISFAVTAKSRWDFSLGYFAAREDLSKLLRTSTWDGVCWTRRPEADNGRK